MTYFIKPPLKFNYPLEKTPVDGIHVVSLTFRRLMSTVVVVPHS